jgi:hypothetical protein
MGPLESLRRIEQQIQAIALSRKQRHKPAQPKQQVKTGIVSVNGRDVEKMHCSGGRRAS